MNFGLIIFLALKELRKELRFTIAFTCGLALALIGPSWIEATRSIFQSVLDAKAKNILGSDLEISGRRDLTQLEMDKINLLFSKYKVSPLQTARTFTLFSMCRSGEQSRLVEIKALDGHYPYYGRIILQDGSEHHARFLSLPKKHQIWVQKDLKYQLNIVKDSPVSLGNLTFKVHDFINDDSLQSVQFTSIAPRIYLSIDDLKESGLVAFGSTINYATHFVFKNIDNFSLNNLSKELEKDLNTVDLKISTPSKASERLQRPMTYTTDYLALVSIGAFIIGAMACFYLYWSYMNKKLSTLALLQMLGMGNKDILAIFSLQLIIMGTLALLLTYSFVFGLQFITLRALKEAWPFINLDFFENLRNLSWASFSWPALIGPITPVLLIPGIASMLKSTHPNILFSESLEHKFLKIENIFILVIPMLFVTSLMCYLLAHSYKLAGIFLLLMAALTLLIYAFYLMFFKFFKIILINKKGLETFLPLNSALFHKYKNIILGLALAFSSSFLVLIPSLKTSIINEFDFERNKNIPTFFLFDIQDDQVEEVNKFIIEQNQTLLNMSPMVRGKIKSINDIPFVKNNDNVKTREEEEEQRNRNRGLNLTYKNVLNEAEKIVEGTDIKDLPQSRDKPWVSIEENYAKSLGIKLGDQIEFEVSGISVLAKVANFRKVRWSSFLPNFFFSLSTGVLEDAPKTHLAAIALNKKTSSEQKNIFLMAFSRKFPTISAIDVEKLMAQIIQSITQITSFLQMMAFYAFFVSFFLMFVVVMERIESFTPDGKLYHLLGMDKKLINKILFYEIAPISIFGQLLGALCGPILSFVLSKFIFDNNYVFDGFWLFIGLIALPLMTGTTLYLLIKWQGQEYHS